MREGKLPLRTILQNFINHVDTLEAKRTEGDDQYEQEFQVRTSQRMPSLLSARTAYLDLVHVLCFTPSSQTFVGSVTPFIFKAV